MPEIELYSQMPQIPPFLFLVYIICVLIRQWWQRILFRMHGIRSPWFVCLTISYEKEKKRGETMAVAMLAFKMTLKKGDTAIQNELLQRIKDRNMAPYYIEVCNFFEYMMDTSLYNEMKQMNDSVIKQKQDEIASKKENGSDDDVLDLLISLVSLFVPNDCRLIIIMRLVTRKMRLVHTSHVWITRCRTH